MASLSNHRQLEQASFDKLRMSRHQWAALLCNRPGGADEARRGVVLTPHPPQLLAFSESHLQPAVTAGKGAFDWDFSGHFPNITTTARGGTGRLQSNAAHWCLLILSLSKDACSSCRWFDRLAMNGLEKTLQSS